MVKKTKLKKVTYYFTTKKIKGIDGKKFYFVTNKADIKYLGGLNSKSTGFSKAEFKRFVKELRDEEATIINI